MKNWLSPLFGSLVRAMPTVPRWNANKMPLTNKVAEEIVKLRPSQTLQTQISELLEKNRKEGLTDDEEEQWQRYEYLEHLVRLAKAEAMLKLKAA